jgi:hypothetical protein
MFSDEATFHLSGYVDEQNVIIKGKRFPIYFRNTTQLPETDRVVWAYVQ